MAKARRARKPPKPGKRTATGRLSRSKDALDARVEDARANNLNVRKREFGVSYVQAANPALVSNVTLLRKFVTKHDRPLSGPQVIAAEFMENAYQMYAKAICSPGAVYGGGDGPPALPAEDVLDRAARRAVARWRDIEWVLDCSLGKTLRVAVINMVIRGEREAVLINALRRGLSAVDAYYLVTGNEQQKTNNK